LSDLSERGKLFFNQSRDDGDDLLDFVFRLKNLYDLLLIHTRDLEMISLALFGIVALSFQQPGGD
jgi:hypothetical protein